ncbi:MAG: hypothetical protein HZC02_01825 [Candidatus Levybacteria bacterium]|nr:hypothetical protein [Candidatus Levybacteria bacterium]
MPAVRDYTFAYEASTADAGITIPMCGYATNDLLIAFAISDTGTPAWVPLSDVSGAASEDAGTPVSDLTDAVSATANDMELTPAVGNAGTGDGYYFGSTQPFNMVRVNVGTAASASWTITWKYWNGSWTTIPGYTDGTTNWTAGTGNRDVTFNPPNDWATTTVVSQNIYWVKAEITAFTSLTTRPLGTQAWVRNWTQLFGRNNTLASICYFKIASSSTSEEDLLMYTATNETYNGSITSIRDINTKTPFGVASIASYSETNADSYASLGNGTITGVAQSFTNTAVVNTIAKVRFYLKKNGTPTGNATAKLYTHSGTLGTSSVPTGTALAVSDAFDVSTLTTTATLSDFVFSNYTNWYSMVASTNYVVSIEYSGGDSSNYVQVGYDNSSPSHGGNYSENTGSWAANSGRDVAFYLQTFAANDSTQAASARFAMPQITTDANNALVLYFNSTSGTAGTPSIIEGPVFSLIAGDGTAESHAVGWGFKATAGSTPNNVYATAAVTGAGVKAVIQVSPPTTGATIIPAYTPQDDCTYIDPIAGVSAYNSNTALAATADTNFGTSLGGFTANDATVAAMADTGINSFHSLGGMTNAATAKTISGAELVLAAANRFNMGTKNLLCHVYAATPAHMQRFSAVSSERGFWMGVRSNTGSGGATTGYKIWQVHGVDAPWDFGFHVPIIVNSGAGNTKATSGTLDTAVIASVGFWNSSIGALTNQQGVGSLWLMDKTVVCGGNSAEPLNVPGIVKTIARGKERQSGILQGAKQMLLLQDIQLGDGGTDPTYLDLDSTATEFPRQYNAATAQVNYNSTDNIIGITYYPGASDTIKHRNSIISSSSRYKWGLHASASTSASYDFSGLIVIGAGIITLNKAITITELTINDYSTLDVSGLTFNLGTILNMPATSDSITTSSSTVISNSSITTTTVTAGNRWASVATADLDMFSGNTFTGSTTSGHAIRLTSTGTVSFSGNTFTSYGPAARSFDASTDVNTTTNIITLDAAHGYNNGEPAYFQDQGGTAPTGLTDGNLYYVRSESSTTITLYDTSAHAIAGGATGQADITATGSGTQYIYSAAAAIYNNSGGAVTINVTNGGSTPSIRNSDGSSTTVNNSVNLTITVIDASTNPVPTAQTAIYRTSDNVELMNEDTETVTAGSFVVGVKYTIVSVGSTDFTAIGAASNTVGVAFTATGVGSGTGTASNGIATATFSYITDTAVYVRVRKSSTGTTKYTPVSTTGTITSTGYSLTVTLTSDTIADPTL